MHTDKLATVHLIELLVRKGVKDFIISPGSRNAPIINELVNRKDVNLYSVADERSAAFVAIGMYLKTKKAVAITCTSGSALLNYTPAVSEAFYQGIPLFILSADRPSIWLDQGEGQTIKQQKSLQNFVNDEFNIALDSDISDYKNLDIEISKSIDKAFFPTPGPVHFNIEYDEPLYNQSVEIEQSVILEEKNSNEVEQNINYQKYAGKLLKSKRVLLLCGQLMPKKELSKLIDQFAENDQVVVLTESTSNLHSKNFIPSIDKTLLTIEDRFEDFRPDILITIGDAIISKIVKRVLRKYKAKEHWQISEKGVFRDTYHSLSESIHLDPNTFFSNLNTFEINNESDYRLKWDKQYALAGSIYSKFKTSIDFSDLLVFDFLFKNIKEDSEIHIANSSPIRYQQLFESNNLQTFCNRGTSGIDGCSSTAVGYALKNEKDTWLISGDVSFLYDSNAWWNKYDKNIKIILVNNGGGGIFRIIPGPLKIEGFENYFETHNPVNINSLCNAFSIEHYLANDMESLKNGLRELENTEGVSLLEIQTPREKNALILNQYFQLLKKGK